MGATYIVETIATKIHIAGLKYIQLRPIEVKIHLNRIEDEFNLIFQK